MYRTAPFALGGADATFSFGLNISNLGGTLNFRDQELPLGRIDSNGNVEATGDSLNVKDAIPATFRFGPSLTVDFDEYNSLTLATDFTKALVSTDAQLTADGDTVFTGNSGFESLFESWGTTRGQVTSEGGSESLSLTQQFTIGAGLEYWYNDLFALRSGYYYEHPDNGDRQFLTFGAGIRYNIVGVDMSYLYTSDDRSPLANTLRFSLLFNFQ
jgi:hypothetical protein